MNRHERTLLLLATVLIVLGAGLRLGHYIDADTALPLLVFGGLLAAAARRRYQRRLEAENHALRAGTPSQELPRP